MASVFDLTTVETVQAWLGSATTTDAPLLGQLITSASRLILNNLSRASILPRAFTETVDGKGGSGISLANWPVLSIASLSVCGTAILPSSKPSDFGKWLLTPAWDGFPPGQPAIVQLSGGFRFPSLPQGVSVAYAAGYQVAAEAATVALPAYQAAVQAPYGPWASDGGVVRASDGSALTLVAGAPAPGQYALLPEDGAYQFAAADVGLAVLITYGFVPMDLVSACMETVGERYRYKDRIGQSSMSLGGQETAAYALTDLNPHVKALIQPYKRVHV